MCVPDQVFGFLTKGYSTSCLDFTPYVILELKAPNMVQSLLSLVCPALLRYCYGTATTDRGDLVILSEFIKQGTTVAALRDHSKWSRIDEMRETAFAALERIHQHGILHRDANGSDILVCDSDVVLVDFDAARVYDELTARVKALEDRVLVTATFLVPTRDK